MKYTLPILLTLVLSLTAQAQSFFGAGLQLKYTTNTRDQNFPEVYAEFGQNLFGFKDTTVSYRLHGSYTEKPDIADLYTRDNNPDRIASAQVILRPAIRWSLNNASYFSPFFGGGVDYTRHFGLPSAPNQSLNPTLSFGTRIKRNSELEVVRIFADRLNRQGFPVQSVSGSFSGRTDTILLKGWRFAGHHELKLTGSAHLIIGAEYSDVVYRACGNLACDAYREYDGIGKVYVGIRIHKGY